MPPSLSNPKDVIVIAANDNHQCFSESTLADYQLGKLDADQMTRVEVEAYSCSDCRTLLVSLDRVVDDTLRILSSIDIPVLPSATEIPGRTPRQETTYQSESFGSYRLIRQIGAGGMGEVWLARHQTIEGEVALKLLPINRLGCERSRLRFERESVLHGELQHENLVKAFDAGEVDGIPYIAMERLHGKDATHWCREDNSLCIAAVCEIIRQTALGLAHAHSRGFVHRDVKPSNIRVTPDATVKLLDMGLLRAFQVGLSTQHTTSDTVLGSIAYMAPEQFCNPSEVTSSADLYSLGCTFFHLLSGVPPFPHEAEEGVIASAVKRHQQRVPSVRQHRKDVPRKLANLIADLTSADPAKRNLDAQQLADELGRYSSRDSLANAMSEPKGNVTENRTTGRLRSMCAIFATAALAATAMLVLRFYGEVPQRAPSPQVRLVAQNTDGEIATPIADTNTNKNEANTPAHELSKTRETINKWLQSQSIKPALKVGMMKSIQQHPDERRWSGQIEDQLFAVVAIESDPKGPARQAIRLAGQRRAHMLAVNDILLTKSLLDAFAKQGLDDAVTLRKAVTRAELHFGAAPDRQNANVSSLNASGRMLESKSKLFDGEVIAYVLANQSDLITHLTQNPQLESVRTSYRKVMHAEARRLMELKQWKDALDLWHHLHSRKLVSPQLYVDAATCFHYRDQNDDALKLLNESFATYQDSDSLDFFEKVGDLAVEIGGSEAETLAVSAYNRAQQLL